MLCVAEFWERLASDLKPPSDLSVGRVIAISQVDEVMAEMVAGRTTGRTIVDFGGSAGSEGTPGEATSA